MDLAPNEELEHNTHRMSRTWRWSIAVVVTLLAVLATAVILFPIFARPWKPKNAVVWAAPSAVLRNAEITIRSGSSVRTTTTDENGGFQLRDDERGKATVDGYVLTNVMHRTGLGDLTVYGPTGEATIRAVDESGKLFKNVDVLVSRPGPGNEQYYSAPEGQIVLQDYPLCMWSGILATPKSRTMDDFVRFRRKVEGGAVIYEAVYTNKPRTKEELAALARSGKQASAFIHSR